jgi:hypothetical protein
VLNPTGRCAVGGWQRDGVTVFECCTLRPCRGVRGCFPVTPPHLQCCASPCRCQCATLLLHWPLQAVKVWYDGPAHGGVSCHPFTLSPGRIFAAVLTISGQVERYERRRGCQATLGRCRMGLHQKASPQQSYHGHGAPPQHLRANCCCNCCERGPAAPLFKLSQFI